MSIAEIPHWVLWLIQGICIFILMASSAVVATKAGRNPYWGVLAIVPFFVIVLIWLLAYSDWPALEKRAAGAPPAEADA
ncbi:MAG: hypothetical protein GC185_04290 [Alphaproteobacteria bacterium]|nr:hypothetical protein [Alphaproteobacteria bacterium]